MIRARRLYLAAMSNGEIGLGILWGDGRFETLRLHQERPISLVDQIGAVIDGVEFDDVVLSFPNPENRQDRIANGAGYTIGLKLRRPNTRIAKAEDAQEVEQHTKCCAALYGQFRSYTVETVERLHAAYKAALRHDMAFGAAMAFSDDAWFARMSFVAQQNASLQETVAGFEIALAECEAASVEAFH